MNAKKNHLVWLGCSLILVIVALFFVAGGKAYSQETEFEKLLFERLSEQKIPVKSVAVLGQDPYQLEVLLQSVSNETKVASEDPAYVHAVQREATLLSAENNFNVDVVRVSILNASTADVLYWAEFSVSTVIPPSQTVGATTDVSEQLENWIESRYFKSDSTNITLERLDVFTDNYGQTLIMEISAPTIVTANEFLPQIMNNRWEAIQEIKEQHGLALSILKIKLFNQEGNVLLDYTFDLQLEQETWWMEDGLTTEWFPHPLPADSP